VPDRDPDCIFCKVLEGEIPSEKVYEDDHALGVMDINPWTRGHAVVFPKRHARNLHEIEDEELEHVAVAAKRLAGKMRATLEPDGLNLLQSNEPAAWQTIFHLHVHVIPRYDGDPLQLPTRPQPAEPEELARVAKEINGA
jgi:histidine triad (HIT) family protein